MNKRWRKKERFSIDRLCDTQTGPRQYKIWDKLMAAWMIQTHVHCKLEIVKRLG